MGILNILVLESGELASYRERGRQMEGEKMRMGGGKRNLECGVRKCHESL